MITSLVLRLGPVAAAWGTTAALALLPILWVSSQAPVARGIALPALAIFLLAMVASQRGGPGELVAGTGTASGRPLPLWSVSGPVFPICLLFAWAVVCAVRVGIGSGGGQGGGPLPVPWAADFARGELLRLAGGIAIFLAVVRAAREWERARRVVDALLLAVVFATVFAYVTHDPERPALAGAFGNRQLLAAFLLLMAPLVVGVACGGREPWRRALAQTAAVLGLAALALTQVRSAWLGGLVSLVVLAALLVRLPKRRGRRRDWRPMLAVGALALTGIGFVICQTELTGSVAARVRTLARLSDDEGTVWRLRQWRVAFGLAREQPVLGHGLGTYPLVTAPRLPQPIPLEVVRATGPNLSLNAHNLYLQSLVETGAVGLGLHLWIVLSFFTTGFRAYRKGRRRGRSLVLAACLAAIAGQSVDALANPAYQFVDVSLFFWTILGLGTAMMFDPGLSRKGDSETGRRGEGESPASPRLRVAPSPRRRVPSLPVQRAAALAGAGALIAGSVAGSTPPANVPTYMPLRSFRVQALTTPGYLTPTLLPGECVEMRGLATLQNGDVRDATPQCRFSRAGGTAPEECVQQFAAPYANIFCIPVGVPASCDGTTLELQGAFEFNGQTTTARSPVLTLSVPRACPGTVITATPQVIPPNGEMIDVHLKYDAPGLLFQHLQSVSANEPVAPGDIEIVTPTHLRLRAVSSVPCRRIYTAQYRFRDRYNLTWLGQVQIYVR